MSASLIILIALIKLLSPRRLFAFREVWKAKDRVTKLPVALKKVLMDNEKEGVSSRKLHTTNSTSRKEKGPRNYKLCYNVH